MIDFHVSIVPLIVIAIGNFFLSWIYYSPAVPWFKTWQRSIGVDPNKTTMSEEDKKSMPRLMGGAVFATFLLSYGLQVVIHSIGANTFLSGMVVGLVCCFTFAVTHSLNTQFEGRKPVLLLINNVHYLITYSIFGGIIAIWQ